MLRQYELEKEILVLIEEKEQDRRYNFFLNRFFIFAVVIYQPVFGILYSVKEIPVSNPGELYLELLLIWLGAYLLAHSKPIKKFLMEWCLLRNLVFLEIKISKTELLRFSFSFAVLSSIIALIFVTDLIPLTFSIICSLPILLVIIYTFMSLFKKYIISIKRITRFYDANAWKTAINFLIAVTSTLVGVILTIIWVSISYKIS